MKRRPLLQNFEITTRAKTIEISTDIPETLDNPIHKKIDDIVFSFFEFDEREKNYVIENSF